MKIKKTLKKIFDKTKKNISSFMKSKKTRTIAKYSYHSYQAFRIYRNPFILLEYLNVFNGLLLIADKVYEPN
tara:strand:- start:788 stop:1003 length:216 start_codon:yes stop_codon:yes gene_type:complete